MERKTEYIDDGTSFFKISPLSINPEYLTKFSLFERIELSNIKDKMKYKYRCLLVDSGSVTKDRLMELLKSWEVVYLLKEQKAVYDEYVKENLHYILNNDRID